MEWKPEITRANLVTAAITLVVVLIAIGVVLWMPATGGIPDMEYAVWRAIMADRQMGEGCVLDPATLTVEDWTFAAVTENLENALEESDLRGPALEAVADFRRKNREPHGLEDRFRPGPPVRFLAPGEVVELFGEEGELYAEPGKGWGEFHRRYSDDGVQSSLVQFSRVGFSREGGIAIAYWSQSSGGKSGWGGVLLLRWTGSAWERVESLGTWVS